MDWASLGYWTSLNGKMGRKGKDLDVGDCPWSMSSIGWKDLDPLGTA